jgi:myo-inositol-1(or 4)-monophosphatase
MTTNELELLTRQVIELAKGTGIFFLHEIHQVKSTDIEEKSIHNFVSYVDKAAETRIVETLGKLLPESGFIAEEGTSTKKGDRFNWIIDPLDGTTNFLHHIPLYSVSIALMDGDEIVLGVVHEPNLNECFYAWKNGPAYLNGQEIRVTKEKGMKNALLATGFPYYDYGKMKEYIDLFIHFAQNSSGLRRLGSAAVDLAYTACGRFEGFYEYGLHPWDVAAGAFIVRQAGGSVTDFGGGNNYLFGGELLASNGLLHNELLNCVMDHFGRQE